MKDQAISATSILIANLVVMILLMPIAQASHGSNSIVVIASKENRVISFNVSNGINSQPIYGFIIMIYAHGHFSEILETPAGWEAGTHGYHAVLWTTKSYPIEPGTTEDNFAMEVTRKGTYTIGWSATDKALQPIWWGTITITVT